MHDFKVGDRVVFASRFLRSVGWYVDVPRDGMVQAIEGRLITVEWSDGTTGPVLSPNLIHADRKHIEPR